MNRVLAKSAFTVGLLALLLAVPVYGASVNKSVKIPDGGESSGESSVNGSITVGSDATVTGSLNTVNGKIRIGANSRIDNAHTVNGSIDIDDGVSADSLETVNGSISLGENATVAGDVEAVNGRIELEKGARVEQSLRNVNGDIRLEGGRVGGGITTVSGDIELADASEVSGDIVVEEPSMWSFGNDKSREPEVVIGPGSKVGGVIRLERKAKLYISETAEVGGVEGIMTMDDAVRFSGERP